MSHVTQDDIDAWEKYGPAIFHCEMTGPEVLARHRVISQVQLLRAATDALAGWRYVRSNHGDLYGVGWDRVENALVAAIAKASPNTSEILP